MLRHTVKLLIVDDDTTLRETLSTTFAALGYTVSTAVDGFSALALIGAELPDILLSDLQMPGMSGFELLYVVQRRFPALRVVAMSGAYSGEKVPYCIAAHAFHEKGSSSQALFQTINTMAAKVRGATDLSSAHSSLMWVAGNIQDCSGQAYVLIACPYCLRTFPEMLSADTVINESLCLYCRNPLRYALVEPSSQRISSPATPKLRLDKARSLASGSSKQLAT